MRLHARNNRSPRLVFNRLSLLLVGVVLLVALPASAAAGLALQPGTVVIEADNAELVQQLASFEGHSGLINAVSISPDGTTVASASNDLSIRLWDLATGAELAQFTGHTDWVRDVEFSPNGALLASSSADGSIRLWDVQTRAEIRSMTPGQPVWDVAFSPNGRLLASVGDDGIGRLWEVASGTQVQQFAGHEGPVFGVAYSPDGLIVATAGDDSTIRLWDVSNGRELNALAGHRGFVNTVAYSPDGSMLASGGGRDDKVILWDAIRGVLLEELTGHEGQVAGLAFSPDGSILASASFDTTIKLWDMDRGRELITLTGHTDAVSGVAFNPAGTLLVSGSGRDNGSDFTVRVWGLPEGVEDIKDGGEVDLGDLGVGGGGGGSGELTETFVASDDSFGFDYPEGWEVFYDDENLQAILSTSADALDRFASNDPLEEDDLVVFILVLDIGSGVDAVDLAEDVINSSDIRASDVEEATAGDYDVAYFDILGLDNDVRLYIVDLGRGDFALVQAFAAEDEIDTYHETVLAVGGTLDPSP